MKISFIGYGNMAQAIAKSLLQDKRYQISAAAPSLPIGVNRDGIATYHNNLSVVHKAEILILAVKPTLIGTVLREVKEAIPKDCLIISVATGLSLSWLAEHCPSEQPIVRCMPNIAIAVKQGATPLISNEWVTSTQKEQATQLFKSSGMISWLKKETDLDILTALSGSGPAYFFLFLESMASAAESLGLSAENAKTFALQTMAGAAAMAKDSKLDFHELRQQVTSPNGTTAAAIHVLQTQQVEHILHEAITAAYQRALELGHHPKG